MSLREKVLHLPKSPGVYFMKDGKDKIIYVGKAKNLKNRVSSYFQDRVDSIKTRALVKEIVDFDLIVTKTEVEALLLERSMIRHHAPRFNILLRDDKEYPFVRVQFNDPWPRIEKVRRRKDDGARYVGPFANAGQLNGMLKTVFRVFPLIRCSPYEFQHAKRPCNYYHMKMCLGPCTLDVSRKDYLTMIEEALGLLEGRNKEIKAQLKDRMTKAADDEQYEQAARLRDQIQILDNIGQHQAAVVGEFEEADAIAVYEDKGTLCFNVTMVRNFAVLASDSYMVGSSIDSLEETLESFLLQYYHSRIPPEHIVLPYKIANPEDLMAAICHEKKVNGSFLFRRKGDADDLLQLAEKNARFFVEQKEALNLKQKAEVEILQKDLGLEQLPRVIECIDISNMQGENIVASNVCFQDGKPAKDRYRRYKVESVQGKNDDFASIREVVNRRLERGLREDDLPDLLLIDGGKGQLSSALEALRNFPQLMLPIMSIAKSRPDKFSLDETYRPSSSKERIFRPGENFPLELEEGSPSFRILTSLRDEAHRFAISFHRQKRKKTSHASILDEVKGIGPILKKRLYSEFGDVEKMRKASLERLKQVPGLSEKTAIILHSFLQEDKED